MSSSSTGSVSRGALYRPYSRSTSTGSVSSVENLPPRTIARVSKEVRDLMKCPPGGINLVVDPETGMPSSLGEVVVSMFFTFNSVDWNMQIGWSIFFPCCRNNLKARHKHVFLRGYQIFSHAWVETLTKASVQHNTIGLRLVIRVANDSRFDHLFAFLQPFDNRQRLKAHKEHHTRIITFV